MADQPAASDLDALGAPYDETYYDCYTGPIPYRREHPEWLEMFGRLAELLIARFAPERALDVGCAKGFLVEALRDRGVEAFGVDVSAYALGEVREDLRPYVRLADAGALDPSERYDLVTCIEVVEHMEETSALAAIDALCALAPRVVFSSSPDDHEEETHHNVQPIGYWVEAFAARGFTPLLEVDLSDFAPQAMAFTRDEPLAPAPVRDLYTLSVERAVTLGHQREELARLAEVQRERDEARQVLAELQSSDGFRVARLLRESKTRLIPPGSWRERAWNRSYGAAASLGKR